MLAMGSTPPPKPTAPCNPADLTPEWMTAALRSTGTETTVAGVRIVPLDGGHGLMSSIFKCELTYAGANFGPRSLIAKILRPHAQSIALAREMGLWEREIGFYERIFPLVNVPISRCYFTVADPSGEAYALLLEDVSALDQPRKLTREQASLAIRTLARLQAQFWGGLHPALGFLQTQQQMQKEATHADRGGMAPLSRHVRGAHFCAAHGDRAAKHRSVWRRIDRRCAAADYRPSRFPPPAT